MDVDEKWFRITSEKENYLLVNEQYKGIDGEGDGEEDEPVTRRTRHKGNIMKVMFLCAQARPRYDHGRNAWWDGKLGMWPIGSWKPAARTSVLRPAGTMEWHNKSVTREVYRNLLLEKVVPSIVEKWPRSEWTNPAVIIRIQQDGPQAHIKPDDVAFNARLQTMGLANKLILYTQPPNSPDLNINDLGFFRALESQYNNYSPRNAADIIAHVEEVYRRYPMHKINRIYISLMGVMNQIIDTNGDNNFDPPHYKKEQLERQNGLPITLEVTNSVYPHLERNESII